MEQVADQRLDDDRPEYPEQRCNDSLTDLLDGSRWDALWRFIIEEEEGYCWLLTELHGNDLLLKKAVLKLLNEDKPDWVADLAEKLAFEEGEQ